MAEQRASSVPVIDLEPSVEQSVAVLRDLQALALKHPVAAQAAFGALAAEGRRFSRTPEGARWRARLAGSELVDRVRLVFETATLWMLEPQGSGVLPSSYVDALFSAAAHSDMEPLLDRLFPDQRERGEHANDG